MACCDLFFLVMIVIKMSIAVLWHSHAILCVPWCGVLIFEVVKSVVSS